MSEVYMLREAVAYQAATSVGQASGRFPVGRVDAARLSPAEVAYLREFAVPLGVAELVSDDILAAPAVPAGPGVPEGKGA